VIFELAAHTVLRVIATQGRNTEKFKGTAVRDHGLAVVLAGGRGEKLAATAARSLHRGLEGNILGC